MPTLPTSKYRTWSMSRTVSSFSSVATTIPPTQIAANSHTQEVTALRVSLTELEREHDRLRKEYVCSELLLIGYADASSRFEAENQRLRQELEAACVSACLFRRHES